MRKMFLSEILLASSNSCLKRWMTVQISDEFWLQGLQGDNTETYLVEGFVNVNQCRKRRGVFRFVRVGRSCRASYPGGSLDLPGI